MNNTPIESYTRAGILRNFVTALPPLCVVSVTIFVCSIVGHRSPPTPDEREWAASQSIVSKYTTRKSSKYGGKALFYIVLTDHSVHLVSEETYKLCNAHESAK